MDKIPSADMLAAANRHYEHMAEAATDPQRLVRLRYRAYCILNKMRRRVPLHAQEQAFFDSWMRGTAWASVESCNVSFIEAVEHLEAEMEASAQDPEHMFNLRSRASLLQRKLRRQEALDAAEQAFLQRYMQDYPGALNPEE